MRLSCNGCRVLRKGCSENCSIKPCLEWIKSPDAQANATVFLAKFYGRAGLMNLIDAGPPHLRPAIFRSLLYEACGRIVNPIYGSAGLLWSGSWQLCQNAVEAVLRAAPVTQMEAEAAECKDGPPLKAYDIRHVSKDDNPSGSGSLHRVRNRSRCKRSGVKSKRSRVSVGDSGREEANRSLSHESSLSHQSEAAGRSRDCESLASAGKAAPEEGGKPASDSSEDDRQADAGEIELDLTLGFEPFKPCVKPRNLESKRAGGCGEDDAGLCKMELALHYSIS